MWRVHKDRTRNSYRFTSPRGKNGAKFTSQDNELSPTDLLPWSLLSWIIRSHDRTGDEVLSPRWQASDSKMYWIVVTKLNLWCRFQCTWQINMLILGIRISKTNFIFLENFIRGRRGDVSYLHTGFFPLGRQPQKIQYFKLVVLTSFK